MAVPRGVARGRATASDPRGTLLRLPDLIARVARGIFPRTL